jgi:hypothetical protein
VNEDLVKEIKKERMKNKQINKDIHNEDELDNYFYDPLMEYSYEKYKEEKDDDINYNDKLDDGFYEIDIRQDNNEKYHIKDKNKNLLRINKQNEDDEEISYSKYFFKYEKNSKTEKMIRNQTDKKVESDDFEEYFIN